MGHIIDQSVDPALLVMTVRVRSATMKMWLLLGTPNVRVRVPSTTSSMYASGSGCSFTRMPSALA